MNKSQIRIFIYKLGIRNPYRPSYFWDRYLKEAIGNLKETKLLII